MADDGPLSRDNRLDLLRTELDAIDARIVESRADRLRVIGVIAAFKETQPTQVRDDAREQALLERLQALAKELRLDPHFVERLFREIIDHSVRRQQEYLLARERGATDESLVVGYQGTDGAWGHRAVRDVPGGAAPLSRRVVREHGARGPQGAPGPGPVASGHRQRGGRADLGAPGCRARYQQPAGELHPLRRRRSAIAAVRSAH